MANEIKKVLFSILVEFIICYFIEYFTNIPEVYEEQMNKSLKKKDKNIIFKKL